jgi:hypothetical protein
MPGDGGLTGTVVQWPECWSDMPDARPTPTISPPNLVGGDFVSRSVGSEGVRQRLAGKSPCRHRAEKPAVPPNHRFDGVAATLADTMATRSTKPRPEHS